MADECFKYRRKSLRLQNYDYAQAGAYFITMCIHNRECLFGEIADQEINLNAAGYMIQTWWLELANKFSTIIIDQYVVMPNHFHGIIITVGADLCVCSDSTNVYGEITGAHDEQSGAHDKQSGAHIGAPLPAMVQWFKTMTTNEYIRGVKQNQWPPFNKRLWQRNYYERIIRNENELNNIRKYIINNPKQWDLDINLAQNRRLLG